MTNSLPGSQRNSSESSTGKYPLEHKPEEFYSRLNFGEADRVREIVKSLKNYMSKKVGEDYLIAGVGGILRYPNPGMAQDIDLAVAGFKYTTTPAFQRKHNFNDVIKFTHEIKEYFDVLNSELSQVFGSKAKFSFDRGGSGPFANSDEKYNFNGEWGESATLESDLEDFGWWSSKGLRVCFEDSRPIDVQFAFNQTPLEWRLNQTKLEEDPFKSRRNILSSFPYAVL
ncbi:MAG: hypothetical protein WD876_03790 [Candidatus Pacearchaeota archaeon]